MKQSTDHLPAWKRNELARIVDVIHAASDDVAMVVLYGSYARGEWKEAADLAADRKSGHVSDYDILVVTGEQASAYDTVLWEDAALECRRLGLSAHVRIIAHDTAFVNTRLAEGQFFFKDIEREGCTLYDSGEVTLAEEQEWTPAERRRIAKEHYEHWYERATRFYRHFEIDIEEKDFKGAAFHLHQSAEAAYKTILLVLTNYCPHEHYLGVLGLMAEEQDDSLRGLFPQDTEARREQFKRFDYAYIGARYDPKYNISADELDHFADRVRRLLEQTETICQAKLRSFGNASTHDADSRNGTV